jgi:hypothetical protein
MKKILLLLSCLLFLLVSYAQRIITGKITDQNGAPVANASVAVKGSATGTTSDII